MIPLTFCVLSQPACTCKYCQTLSSASFSTYQYLSFLSLSLVFYKKMRIEGILQSFDTYFIIHRISAEKIQWFEKRSTFLLTNKMFDDENRWRIAYKFQGIPGNIMPNSPNAFEYAYRSMFKTVLHTYNHYFVINSEYSIALISYYYIALYCILDVYVRNS